MSLPWDDPPPAPAATARPRRGKRRHPAARARRHTLLISLAAMAGLAGGMAIRDATTANSAAASPAITSDAGATDPLRAFDPFGSNAFGRGGTAAIPDTTRLPGRAATSSRGS